MSFFLEGIAPLFENDFDGIFDFFFLITGAILGLLSFMVFSRYKKLPEV